jgi:hypothetical protein
MVRWRGDEKGMTVNWLMIESSNDSGKVTYRNSFITDLEVTRKIVAELAAGGRARWKIENETFNVLKTKGYNLENNFGHGKQHLATVLAIRSPVIRSVNWETGLGGPRRGNRYVRGSSRACGRPPLILCSRPGAIFSVPWPSPGRRRWGRDSPTKNVIPAVWSNAWLQNENCRPGTSVIVLPPSLRYTSDLCAA